MSKQAENRTSRLYRKSTFREYFETIVISVIIVLFAKTFVFQHFKIPTGSMIKTLLIGDHLMVNRYIFRREPLALLNKILPNRMVRRGDVVVFKYPDDPTKDFIKRVIGVPGDRIEVQGDDVYVNGHRLEEPYLWLDPKLASRWKWVAAGLDGATWDVPDRCYFMMGDNRYNSHDSRLWHRSFVREDEIKGRALFVWWSYDGPQDIDPRTGYGVRLKHIAQMILHLPIRTRWSRSFTRVR